MRKGWGWGHGSRVPDYKVSSNPKFRPNHLFLNYYLLNKVMQTETHQMRSKRTCWHNRSACACEGWGGGNVPGCSHMGCNTQADYKVSRKPKFRPNHSFLSYYLLNKIMQTETQQMRSKHTRSHNRSACACEGWVGGNVLTRGRIHRQTTRSPGSRGFHVITCSSITICLIKLCRLKYTRWDATTRY